MRPINEANSEEICGENYVETEMWLVLPVSPQCEKSYLK